MLLLERLQEFRKAKDQYEDAWDTQDWILDELEAALAAQCVRRDRPISRKHGRREAERLLEALKYIFYIIEDAERGTCESPALNRHVDLEFAEERRKLARAKDSRNSSRLSSPPVSAKGGKGIKQP